MAFSSKLELKRFPDVSVSYPTRKDFASLESCEIFSYDTDKDKNLRVISKIANATQFKAIQFNGFTSFLRFKYQFPIYCSRREFIMFLINVKDHDDRRTLFEEGILTTSMYNDFPYVWRNMFGNATKLAALGSVLNYTQFVIWISAIGSFLFWTFYGFQNAHDSLTSNTLLVLAMVNSNNFMFSIVSKGGVYAELGFLVIVMFEEYVKRFVPGMSFGYGLGFAIFEIIHKVAMFYSQVGCDVVYMIPVMILPFLMHPVAGYLHFLHGSVLHYLWNLYVGDFLQWIGRKFLKCFEEPVYEKDWRVTYKEAIRHIPILAHRRRKGLPPVLSVFDDHGWNFTPLVVCRRTIIEYWTSQHMNQHAHALRFSPFCGDEEDDHQWLEEKEEAARLRSIKFLLGGIIVADDLASSMETVSYVLDVILKVVKGDVPGLVLSAGMRASYLKDILAILSFNDFDELVKEFRPEKCSLDEEVVMIGHGSAYAIFSSVVPDFVSKSPFTRKLAALCFILTAIPMCQDLTIMKRFSQFIQWDTMPDGSSIIEITLAATKAVYDAYFRVTETGDWKSIFGLHEDVAFIQQARKYLLTNFDGSTEDDVLKHMEDVKVLIDKRALKWNEGHIGQLIQKLQDHLKQIQQRMFDAPFVEKVHLMQSEICPKMTYVEMVAKCAEIQSMIYTRKYLHNDANINKLIAYLVEKAKEYTLLIMDCRVRKHPFLINLMGVPGFGKTVLINVLKTMITKYRKRHRFVGDTLIYRPMSEWPCESGIHKLAWYLEANDIINDWSNAEQNGKEPLDLFIQRFMDTNPFEIDAAFNKGVILNDIEFGIFTSNFTDFVGAYPALKLRRRFNKHAVNAWCWFEGHPSEKEIEVMGLEERNSRMRFTLLECQVQDAVTPNWCFRPIRDTRNREIVFDLPRFLQHVMVSIERHDVAEQRAWDLFSNPDNTCACGVPYVMHFVDPSDRSHFTKICSDCVDPIYDDEIEILSGIDMTGYDLITPNAWTLLVLFLGWYYVKLWIKSLHQHALLAINKLEEEVITSGAFPPIYKFYLRKIGYDKFMDLDNVCRMYAFSSKVRAFTTTHERELKALLVAISTGAACAYFMKHYGTEMIGNPIYREQVDPKSMILLEPTREQRWTAEQRRDWGKDESMMTVFKPIKVGVGLLDIQKIMKRATRLATMRCEIDGKPKVVERRVIFWSAQWCSMNKHFLPDGINSFTLTIDGAMQRYERSDLLYSDVSELFFFPNLFDASCYPLYEMLPSSMGSGVHQIYSTLGDYQGEAQTMSFISPDDMNKYKSFMWVYPGEPGDCGNLVCVNTGNSWCVAGFVSAKGKTKLSYFANPVHVTMASLIDRQVFDNAIKKDPYPFVVQHDASNVDLIGMPDLSAKADIRHLDSPFLVPLGTLDGASNTFKSKFQKTEVYEDFAPLLSEPFGYPSKIKGEDSNGSYQSTFLQTFNVLSPNCDITYTEFENAMKGYLDDAIPLDYVKEKDISLRPMSEMEAMFGDPKIGVDRINFSTSCGPTYTPEGIKDKTQLFEKAEDPTWELQMIKRYQERLVKLRNSIAHHTLPYLKVKFAVKDEVRKLSKLMDYAVRLFSVVDFEYNHFMRMLLMPIVSFLLSHPMLSECFGGINAGSKQWHQLAQHLRKHKFFIDMDFKTFDVAHRLIVVIMVANFFYRASKRLGYTEEEATWSYLMVRCLCVQYLIFHNDVMLKMFGLPSGIIITLIMNSIVNSVLMRVAFVRLTKKEVSTFKTFVSAATTGDDNASGISEEIIDVFNMETIREVYILAGYKVTSAKKDNTIKKHLPFEELDFLKRKFKFDERVNMYVAPISKDSIWKSLCFQSKELGVSPLTRLSQCAESAQREAWLHGEDFFQEMQSRLKESFKKRQLFLSYRELSSEKLLAEFLDGSFKTFMC